MERKWQVLLVTSLGVFMAALDSTIVNISFPNIVRQFSSAKLSDLSWVLNGYTVLFAAALIPAGRIADVVGRKRVFIAGLVTFTLASLLCGVAPNHYALIAARLVQGVGGAMMTPPALGLVLAEFPITQRATALGLWSVAGGLAAATGPPLGGVLNDLAGWRWVFLVNLPVGIIGGFFAVRILREVRDPNATRLPDLIGAAVLAAGVGVLALAVVKTSEWGWTDPRVLGSGVAAVALFALFVYRAAHHPLPIVQLSLWQTRTFGVANVATLLFGMGFFAMILGASLFLTQVWGYSTLRAGLAIGPGPLTAAIFGGIAGRLGDRLGQRALLVPGGAIFTLGLLWIITRMDTVPDYLGTFLPGFMLTGVGVGMIIPSLTTAAVAGLPPNLYSTGGGVNNTARQIGAVFGVAILIAIIGRAGASDQLATFREAFIFSAVCVALAGLSGLALGRLGIHETPAAVPTVATAGD